MKERSVVEVYLSRWDEGSDTYKTMRSALDNLTRVLGGLNAVTFGWEALRFEDVRGIPAKLAHLEPSTINKHLSALRGVLETAKDMQLLPEIEYQRIQVRNVRGRGEPAGRSLDAAEKTAVVAHLTSLPPQEAALIAVMLGAGARCVEAVRVRRDDFDPVAGRITLYGKGRKKRKVPLGGHWLGALEAWRKTFAANELLFPWTRRQATYVVERLSRALGGRKFTPHDLRRTFGTHICEVADVVIAQRLLGHADVKTTLLYDRRGEEAENEAVKDW